MKTILANQKQRGVTLVEMMVGIAVGLVIIGGALSLMATNVRGTRQIVADTRLEQDLRNIADLVTRDLRRAGYWGQSVEGTKTLNSGTTRTATNPYIDVAATTGGSGGFSYAFSRDSVENNTKGSNEDFGFSLTDGELRMQTATSTSAPLNDVHYTMITGFSVTDISPEVIWLGYRCETVKNPGGINVPYLYVRRYNVTITGQSVLDTSVTRTLKTSVRVRNDKVTGDCDR